MVGIPGAEYKGDTAHHRWWDRLVVPAADTVRRDDHDRAVLALQAANCPRQQQNCRGTAYCGMAASRVGNKYHQNVDE